MIPNFEEMRALVARQWQQREEERRWLAREIHSTLAQDLTVLSMELSLLERRITSLTTKENAQELAAVRAKLLEMSAIVRKTIEWTRWVKNRLRPKVLDEFGLTAAARWRVGEFQRETGLTCSVEANPETIELEPAMATDCFRILETVLLHVMQVKDVTHVHISLAVKNNTFIMDFNYDGHDVADPSSKVLDSLWLTEVAERALVWGGSVTTEYQENKGQTVHVTLPYTEARTV